jgi:uncharacterized membrane protein HdeD (DUF308 family)
VLGYFTFRDFNNGAAVWMLARWIGVGFIFQGVTATALAIDVPALPERGWYVFVRILTVIAGVVTLVWPISSIVVLAITAGVWLVLIGITQVVWALSARRTVRKMERHSAPRQVLPASLRRDGEPRRHRQPQLGHLGQVRALTT